MAKITSNPPVEFDPPSSYALEPELYGPPPRQIPDALGDGPYARGQKRVAIGFATFGALCLLLKGAPGLDRIAQYIPALAYLQWIGLGALLVALVIWVGLARRSGPFRYVRDGQPLIARVVELTQAPSVMVNGVPSQYAFTAHLLFRHPESGEATLAGVKSTDFSADARQRYECPFRVGDYVTALYLPGKLERSLRLYTFLELSSERCLRRDAGRAENASPWKLAALIVVVVGFLGALVGNLYLYGRYEPIDFEYRRALWPMVAGGLLLGGGLFAFVYLQHRREQAAAERRSAEALATGRAIEATVPFLGGGVQGWFLRLIVAVGAPLIGAATTLAWCFAANALLDTSVARRVPATITKKTMTTHAFLFREYHVEFTLAGTSEKQKLLTTPEHLRELRGELAEALVREGRFGWAWVETLRPIEEGPSAPAVPRAP